MPFYSSQGSPGVVPARDQNYPNPEQDSGDPMQKPDFVREWEADLVQVRRELSALWAEEYDVKYGSAKSKIPVSPYGPDSRMTVSGIERDQDIEMRKRKLEEREAALTNLINTYKYVASLGDAMAAEDEPGEPTNSAPSGATSAVYRR